MGICRPKSAVWLLKPREVKGPFNNVKKIICFGQEGLLLHFIFDRSVKQFWKHDFQNNQEGPIWDFPISSDQPGRTTSWKAPWFLWLNWFSSSGDDFAQQIPGWPVPPCGWRDWTWSWLLSHLECGPKVEATIVINILSSAIFTFQDKAWAVWSNNKDKYNNSNPVWLWFAVLEISWGGIHTEWTHSSPWGGLLRSLQGQGDG